MKEIWLLALGENWDEEKEKIKDAIEIGFTGVVVRRGFEDKAKKLGRIRVFCVEDKVGERFAFVEVKSAEDQEKALELSERYDYLFLSFSDWKIIPLENLIAMKKRAKLIAIVKDLDEAKVVLTTLERGADGIAIEEDRREVMRKFYELASGEKGFVGLKRGEIVEIKPLGVGDRVCIDTVTLMNVGEGMLVGNKAGFMFLIASESEESEYVSSRPFRVNAGSVNAYLKVGERTRYLSELKAGDEVEIVSYNGETRRSYVGRVKIEKRPLILVKAVSDGEEGTVILQNAETIKLVNPDGKHISVAKLKVGDEVLVWIGEKARHFGVGIEEFIIER
ncbi:MAG: 3-dehydroquinate synthase II [Archaeoglobales archaeon]|nr:MAG: 3-dehydroquinate synthase II [Archaeoglobales archaeon]